MLKLLIKRVQQIKEIVGESEDLSGIADFNNVQNPAEEEIMPLSR